MKFETGRGGFTTEKGGENTPLFQKVARKGLVRKGHDTHTLIQRFLSTGTRPSVINKWNSGQFTGEFITN